MSTKYKATEIEEAYFITISTPAGYSSAIDYSGDIGLLKNILIFRDLS